MGKLPFLLVLLLFSLMLLAAAASAHATTLPLAVSASALTAEDEEAEAGDEADVEGEEAEAEDVEGEGCGAEEDELCEEEAAAGEVEECLVEDASASFTASPGAGAVRLRIRYRAFEATAVVVDARLRGAKGSLNLGSHHTRFHRAGVYRYSFALDSKQMAKAVAARDFEVGLHAVGAPAGCALHLAARGPHRAK